MSGELLAYSRCRPYTLLIVANFVFENFCSYKGSVIQQLFDSNNKNYAKSS